LHSGLLIFDASGAMRSIQKFVTRLYQSNDE